MPIAEKHPKTRLKKVEEKLTSNFCRSFLKSFRHGLFAKIFLWFVVFLNCPPCREAPKNIKHRRTKKKGQKKAGWWVGWAGI
jgi:hypothetical protein